MIRRRYPLALALVASLGLSACGGSDQGQTPPPTLVQVIRTGEAPLPNFIDVPGRIEAVKSAEVRARTDGIVERRLYQEGTDVREGASLFLIDPRDKRAALEQARAALRRATAARNNAASIVTRYGPLVSQRAVSAQENEAALSQLQQAEAAVADARAAVNRAELELSYTRVTAPISGRAGRAEITEGALVSAASATLMTRVEQLDPIYAVFTYSSAALSDLLDQARSGEVKLGKLHSVKVRLQLENGDKYAATGRLDFADLTVDPSTGSQTLRATFSNPERRLLPGQFVRAQIEAGTTARGIGVPARAVQISDQAASVMVVKADGTTESRTVELGGQVAGQWVIRHGLKAGEVVVVEGWAKVRPGQKVQTEPFRAAGR